MLGIVSRLQRERSVAGRAGLSRSVVRGTGFLGLIYLAFALSSAFPPLAPIGLPIVVLGALAGTFAIITLVAIPLGMAIY